ncbi:hypothetical protein HY971_03100 [Candidatus Kaiserbacteria bacterium]|nr:hypothetical protein [Candidatus Kaiserbacteria bacterium]
MIDNSDEVFEKYDKPLLAYEEFVQRCSNFASFFAPIGSMVGDMNRSKPVYQSCLADHPELAALAAELQAYDFYKFDIDEKTGRPIIKPPDPQRPVMLRKLYDAYLLIRPYAKKKQDLPI